MDWQRLRTVAARHRVEGFVHDGLLAAKIELPAELQRELRGRSRQIAARSLALATTTLAIVGTLRAAGIRALAFKGSSIEKLAYGELGLKSARDIDVIVAREDLVRAGDALQAGGWRRIAPPPGMAPHLLERYFDCCKDAAFVHEERGVRLELHHSLVGPGALQTIGAASPARDVELFPGQAVPTFEAGDLFVYLCVHGAIHHWWRLKWLADFAALIARRPADEIARLHAVACDRGAGRFSGQALLLTHHLLGVPLPGALRAELERDRRIGRMCARSLAAIEHGQTRLDLRGMWEAFVEDTRLGGGWRSGARALRRYFVSPEDLVRVPLPERLFFLYYVLRIPLFLVRRVFG